jgi:hypothetical protein
MCVACSLLVKVACALTTVPTVQYGKWGMIIIPGLGILPHPLTNFLPALQEYPMPSSAQSTGPTEPPNARWTPRLHTRHRCRPGSQVLTGPDLVVECRLVLDDLHRHFTHCHFGALEDLPKCTLPKHRLHLVPVKSTARDLAKAEVAQRQSTIIWTWPGKWCDAWKALKIACMCTRALALSWSTSSFR